MSKNQKHEYFQGARSILSIAYLKLKVKENVMVQ